MSSENLGLRALERGYTVRFCKLPAALDIDADSWRKKDADGRRGRPKVIHCLGAGP